jgi:hypothetical protein
VQTREPVKRGTEKPTEAGQKRISVKHEFVQQLEGCDSSPAHPLCDEACSYGLAHPFILAQQFCAFDTAKAFGFPSAGQRKVLRHTITNALAVALCIMGGA